MHPLLQQVRTIAHMARRLVLGRAFAIWFSIVLGATLAAALADYYFRFRELPLRWLSLFAVVGTAIGSWRKWVGPALADRWSDGQVAQTIERHFPDLRDRLSSAVEFLHQPSNDLRFGSPSLRADIVRRTTAIAAERNLAEVLNERLARRAWFGLAAVAIGAGGIIGSDPGLSMLALRRLSMPWHQEAWPRQQHLVFTKHLEMLPYGHDFEVELVDENERLPADVTIWYWFDGDDQTAARAHRMVFAGGKMTHRLPGVTRSFHYRAVGGDDLDMAWHALRVVVPPKITESRITLHPPTYTGRPPENSARRIQALSGTTAELHIQLDKPITSAVLRFHSAKSEQRFPARLSADGRSGDVSDATGRSWILTVSGTYGWELTDREGMVVVVDDNTEVDVIPDLPPVVSIESPESNSSFSARALVPLRLSVKDDLAIHKIKFHSGELTKVLADYPMPKSQLESGNSPEGQVQVVEFAWDLSELSGLQPGSTLTYSANAEDFSPQSSQPATDVIRIISDAEFQQRLDQTQGALLERMKKALQLQRAVHSQTSALATQLKSGKKLTEADAGMWPALEHGQKRVASVLSGEDGARQILQRLSNDLTVNRWDSPELVSHLKTIQSELERITDKLLPPVQRQISEADRLLRFDKPDYADVQRGWVEATDGQQQVIAALESLVDQLGHWDRYRNLAQEVRQVVDEHNLLTQEIQDLPTAGRDLAALSPEERVKLERLAQRLTELAAQVDRLQSRLDQLHQGLAESNPRAATTLQDALEVLKHEPVSGDMREAARSVTDNRLGSATKNLEATQAGLEKLLAALERQPQADTAALEQLLRKAIHGIATRQELLIGDTKALQGESANSAVTESAARDLAKTQLALAQDLRDLAQRVPKSSGYAVALEIASGPMDRAGERLAKNQTDEITLRMEHAALDLLKDVLSSLAESQSDSKAPSESPMPPQPPAEQSVENQPSLAELKLIRLIQLELLRRTTELEDSRKLNSPLSEEQQRELDELTARQRRLAELLEESDRPSHKDPPKDELPNSRATPLKGANRRLRRADHFVLTAWQQREQTKPPQEASPPTRSLDRTLLDDLPPGRKSEPAGEDVGQPSESSPFADLGRQMRQIEARFREADTSTTTQQLQRRVAAKLTSLIEELQQRQTNNSQQSPSLPKPQTTPEPKSSPSMKPGVKPGSGVGGTATDEEGITNWARGVWGVLPNQVRQQIQDLSDEQFLPEYEEIIRRYYDRLSERGRKEP